MTLLLIICVAVIAWLLAHSRGKAEGMKIGAETTANVAATLNGVLDKTHITSEKMHNALLRLNDKQDRYIETLQKDNSELKEALEDVDNVFIKKPDEMVDEMVAEDDEEDVVPVGAEKGLEEFLENKIFHANTPANVALELFDKVNTAEVALENSRSRMPKEVYDTLKKILQVKHNDDRKLHN
jgi:hypothetical protein